MMAPWAATVRNTFVHIPDEALDLDRSRVMRKSKSDSLLEHRADDMMAFVPSKEQDAEAGSFCELTDDGITSETETGSRAGGSSSIGGSAHRFGDSPSPISRVSSRKPSYMSSASEVPSLDSVGSEHTTADRPPKAALDVVSFPVSVVVPVPMVFLAVNTDGVRRPTEQMLPHSESTCVSWTVDAEQLKTESAKVVSEQFLVDVPGLGRRPFQAVLYAAQCRGRPGALGFDRSCGNGRVEVRSLSQLPGGAGSFLMSVAVGAGGRAQPARPPAPHDFSARPCCGWRKWAFRSAVDPATRRLTVQFDFVPPAAPHGALRRRQIYL